LGRLIGAIAYIWTRGGARMCSGWTAGDGPVDKSDWEMTPQTVDAYNGTLRDIVFPAAILQPPGFDANRLGDEDAVVSDDAIDYVRAVEKGANDKARRAERHRVVTKLIEKYFPARNV
jgi:hypothetical protein